jgi:hypothetical protein
MGRTAAVRRCKCFRVRMQGLLVWKQSGGWGLRKTSSHLSAPEFPISTFSRRLLQALFAEPLARMLTVVRLPVLTVGTMERREGPSPLSRAGQGRGGDGNSKVQRGARLVVVKYRVGSGVDRCVHPTRCVGRRAAGIKGTVIIINLRRQCIGASVSNATPRQGWADGCRALVRVMILWVVWLIVMVHSVSYSLQSVLDSVESRPASAGFEAMVALLQAMSFVSACPPCSMRIYDALARAVQ